MHPPRIQFNMRFLLTVMFAVALIGGAAKVWAFHLPLAGAFPYSIGFSCYIIVLIVGLSTSLSRMESAPSVYRRSAAGCAVILFSHVPGYLFQAAVVYFTAPQGPVPAGTTLPAPNDDWRLTAFGWFALLTHLLWAAGFVLLLSAIQQRGEQIAENAPTSCE
jgi:hypothetical protein